MSRKQRKQQQKATAATGRPAPDDEAYRPFKDVKLVEKKEQKQEKKQQPKKSEGLTIGGFDKHADFGDILDAWTGGQDPDKVRHDEPKSRIDDKRSFASIFAEWETSQGIKPKFQKKEKKIKKSTPYQQTMDFGDILNAYEGKPKQRQKPQQTQTVGEKKKPTQPQTTPQKSEIRTSGKSFGELLDQFDGTKPKQKQKEIQKNQTPAKEPVSPQKSEVKASGKSFGELLDQFDGTDQKKEQLGKQLKQETVTPQKSEVQSSGKDFGELLDQFEGKQTKEEATPQKSEVKSSGLGFGDILENFEDSKQKEKEPVAWSFAQIYKKWDKESNESKAIEKSKEQKKERDENVLTIGELRNMQPQVTLDLHGYKAEEADKATRDFLEDSMKHGLKKICIIPGKGIHNENGVSVLKDIVLSEIRLSGLVREAYSPKACYGGSGAIWVILKDEQPQAAPSKN